MLNQSFSDEFKNKRVHLMLNLDETCLMASDINLKFIADSSRKNMK